MKFKHSILYCLFPGITAAFADTEPTVLSIDHPAEEHLVIQEVILKGGFLTHRDLLQKKLTTEFAGKVLNVETVKTIREAILVCCQEEQAFCAVSIPEQDVSSGVVTFVLDQSKVNQVCYSDTKWFKKQMFEKNIAVVADEPFDRSRLLDDAAWMNRNPFHYTQIILSPGSEPNSTDVQLSTKERFPIRVYAGADNTGTSFSENARLYAGFNWGNALWSNDLLSFQYMASPDFHRFISYYANYTSFLPWKHILTVYGGYSTIHPDITDFKSEGKNAQGSFRYQIPFKPLYTCFQQEVSCGFDYKFLNSNLFFIGDDLFPIVSHAVNIAQLELGYQLQNQLNKHKFTFKIEGFYSPGSWLPNQSRVDYNGLRPFSHVNYFYAKTALGDTYQLPRDFSLTGLLRAQMATGALLPSEQFGLGGYDTVRGYDERAFNADEALCLNVELHTPSLLSSPRCNQELYFLAFVDFGVGYNYDAVNGMQTNEFLLGVGPGLRWNIKTNLAARLDYGFQLHSILGDSQFGMVHGGIVLSY